MTDERQIPLNGMQSTSITCAQTGHCWSWWHTAWAKDVLPQPVPAPALLPQISRAPLHNPVMMLPPRWFTSGLCPRADKARSRHLWNVSVTPLKKVSENNCRYQWSRSTLLPFRYLVQNIRDLQIGAWVWDPVWVHQWLISILAIIITSSYYFHNFHTF